MPEEHAVVHTSVEALGLAQTVAFENALDLQFPCIVSWRVSSDNEAIH